MEETDNLRLTRWGYEKYEASGPRKRGKSAGERKASTKLAPASALLCKAERNERSKGFLFPSAFSLLSRMQSIRVGGFAAGPEAQRRQANRPRSSPQQREPNRFYKFCLIRYCGSRDEARTTACGGYHVRAEISRNEQSRHEGELRRLRLRKLSTLVGCGATPRRSFSFTT